MKKSILLGLFLFGTLSPLFSQTQPGWQKAKSDINKDKIELNKWFSNFEVGNLEDFKITQQEGGRYIKYSSAANNSLYKYVYEPDLLCYTFDAAAPENDKGEKYTFKLTVTYTRSDFSSSYGKPRSDYKFYGVGASVGSYEGEDLNDASLFKLLEKYSANHRAFETGGRFDLSRIDSIGFERLEKDKSASHGAQEYIATIKGEGVHRWSDYEYDEVADVLAFYKVRLLKDNKNWVVTSCREYKTPEYSNIRENRNYPAVTICRDAGLAKTYQRYETVEVGIHTYRYLADLCRIIQSEVRLPREEFEKIELMKTLFNSEEGTKVVDQIYQIKNMISKYSLTVKDSYVRPVYGKGVEKDARNDISIHYSLTRKLTKDEWKQTKSDGADKRTLAITKYPADGYIDIIVELNTDGSKIYITTSNIRNQLYHTNGGRTRHPLE